MQRVVFLTLKSKHFIEFFPLKTTLESFSTLRSLIDGVCALEKILKTNSQVGWKNLEDLIARGL